MANIPAAHKAYAESSSGSSTSAKINVSARVLERTSMRLINQVQELVVTNRDVMNGYVDIPAASRINVKSNNPRGYFLMFEVMNGPDNIFNTITVGVGGREVQLSPSGGWIPQPYMRGGATMDLNYQFALSKDAQPGTYSWPIIVSVTPM